MGGRVAILKLLYAEVGLEALPDNTPMEEVKRIVNELEKVGMIKILVNLYTNAGLEIPKKFDSDEVIRLIATLRVQGMEASFGLAPRNNR
jgi:hypothetical protein